MSRKEAVNMLGSLGQVESGLDDQLNARFANESSRAVKICMLKQKCIIMFSFMLISLLQFVYIVFKEVMDDGQLRGVLLQLAGGYGGKSKENVTAEIN